MQQVLNIWGYIPFEFLCQQKQFYSNGLREECQNQGIAKIRIKCTLNHAALQITSGRRLRLFAEAAPAI